MNERDSEQVARQFQDRGYELVDDENEADVVLLNTCSVRDQAEQKALGNMNRLHHLKHKNPRVLLGFLGCMAQSRGQELFDRLPRVDLVVGTQRFHRVVDYVEQILGNGGHRLLDIEKEEGSEQTIRDHVRGQPRATAYISIMQGCNLQCAFCIVPSVRGNERSRPATDIEAEARALAGEGVREITLLGQAVNLYGREEPPGGNRKSAFVRLLERLNPIDGIERIRFASSHPIGFREDLVEAIAALPKVCEHVHLPSQSGSTRVLKAMRRGYTADQFRRLVARLRETVPDLALSTDLIVGFPGETEAEFRETMDFVKEIEFDQAFVFKFSPRKGTPAASMDGQLPREEIKRRHREALAAVNAIIRQRLRAEVGQEREVLVEGRSETNPQRLTGRTRQNRITVFEGPYSLRRRLIQVRIEKAPGFVLIGTPTF
jgi:tRNA-2-methylthio-N6-dimethylallyladenosine synthase